MGGRRILWAPGLTEPLSGPPSAVVRRVGREAGGGRRQETEAGQCQTRPGCRECPKWPQPPVPLHVHTAAVAAADLAENASRCGPTGTLLWARRPSEVWELSLCVGNSRRESPGNSRLLPCGFAWQPLQVTLGRYCDGNAVGDRGPACPSEDKLGWARSSGVVRPLGAVRARGVL